MPRKGSASPYEPPRKKVTSSTNERLKQGELIVDNTGKTWKLGKAIGIGGFGEIYDISEKIPFNEVRCKTNYVAKVEKHTNGPLFVEINCYLRLGKLELIQKWIDEHSLTFLGMPHFVASGSFVSKDEKYRFLIMPKYNQDLEALFQKKRIFNLKTVLVIATRIIDTLEYIHRYGYIHSDIKASNIMLGRTNKKAPKERASPKKSYAGPTLRSRPVAKTCSRRLRSNNNLVYVDDIPFFEDMIQAYKRGQTIVKFNNKSFEGDPIYLLDYGLASKYVLSNGEHRDFTMDQRRAHAGTVLFCSRDAHKGMLSRRSDLESLAYNMIYWLTGTLPWVDDVHEPELVEKKKTRCFTDVKTFLEICFEDCPRFLMEMFTYLSQLQFKEAPNYDFFRVLFKKTIRDYGYKDDSKLDFNNLEGWGRKQKKVGKAKSTKKENESLFKKPSFLLYSPLKPLSSNIIFNRPKLRKKIKDKLKKDSMMNWSKILMDPETIIKQHRRNMEYDDKGFDIRDVDLESLNPTPAMREVFERASEREGNSPFGSRGDELSSVETIDGYTGEMMRVHKRMLELKEIEFEKAMQSQMATKKRGRRRTKKMKSPLRSSTNFKSESTSSAHILKKKSGLLKRTYSLRG